MDVAALIARLTLALVFVVAGSAKLADRKGSRLALIDFGFPAALANPLGLLLPLAELAVAATLLPAATAPWAALGALVLLMLFMAGISLNLASGRKPDCHCFGQIHSAPAGWKTLARNGALAILAGFLVWQGWGGNIGPDVVGWIWALAGVLALAVLIQRLMQNGYFGGRAKASSVPRKTCGSARTSEEQQTIPAAPKIGEPAPEIKIQSPSGESINLWSIQGEETLVLFYNPNCVFSQQMLPDLKRWEENPPEGAPGLLVISTGARQIGIESPMLFDRTFAIFREFGASETPSAVLVDTEGKVASEIAVGATEVLQLAGQRQA